MSNRMQKALWASAASVGLLLSGGATAQSVSPENLPVVDPMAQPSAPAPQDAAEPVAAAGVAPASGDVASLEAPVPGSVMPSAYLSGSARVSDDIISGWLANPQSMIVANPNAGLPMSSYVTSLTGSDNRSVAVLLTIGRDGIASPAQQAAIGAGMARAVLTAQTVAPEYAAFVLDAVAQSGSPRVIAAFQAALSQTATAALGNAGAGAAGGAGAGGGPGSVSGGGAQGASGVAGTTSTVATSDGSFSVGGSGSPSFSTTTTLTDGAATGIASPAG
ncbi:hypothetical protein [Aureimonas sp. SA4125]|uniref:hypothetical protein n=1 Tax=Aureimonas sp. SA4125 TaxID=2826993 RepID=UPI001CC44AA1|nr:hypothetical protein [Aureimonas sp. SA4125]